MCINESRAFGAEGIIVEPQLFQWFLTEAGNKNIGLRNQLMYDFLAGVDFDVYGNHALVRVCTVKRGIFVVVCWRQQIHAARTQGVAVVVLDFDDISPPNRRVCAGWSVLRS